MNVVKKIVLQILAMLWKVMKLYVWNRLRPYFGTLVLGCFVIFGIMAAIVVLLIAKC